MTNENEELKNILAALEIKLGNLAQYENLLIKEAQTLKNMYHQMVESTKKTEELLSDFSQGSYVFFRDFDERIHKSIEETLSNLLSEYNIHFTLLKKEYCKQDLDKKILEIMENLASKVKWE